MLYPLTPDSASSSNRVELEFRSPSLALVSLVGEHDLAGLEPLQEALAAATRRHRHVLVDLSDCVFLDSSVISVLLHAQDHLGSDSTFALIVPITSTLTARVLRVMRLDQTVRICASLEEALADVESD